MRNSKIKRIALSCDNGRIEVAKLKEILYSQNYNEEFDMFIDHFHKEIIGFHKESKDRLIFVYTGADDCIYWLYIDFDTDVNQRVGKHRKIINVSIDYFDINRDYRNG